MTWLPFDGGQAKPDGEAGKKRGMQQAIDHAEESWRDAFDREVRRLAHTGLPFTSEDVTAAVDLPRGRKGMNRNNAVGAMMNALAKRGVIRKHGYTKSKVVSSHAAILAVWIGAGNQ